MYIDESSVTLPPTVIQLAIDCIISCFGTLTVKEAAENGGGRALAHGVELFLVLVGFYLLIGVDASSKLHQDQWVLGIRRLCQAIQILFRNCVVLYFEPSVVDRTIRS